jgi:hypothetical protein
MMTNTLVIAILASFVIIPFLPREILMLTDLILVRLVLLGVFFAAINVSPQVGMLSLASIGFLFIERNKQKVRQLQGLMQLSTSDSPAIRSIQSSETAPEQPPFTESQQTNTAFSPQQESGDDTFNPVAPSLNEKTVLKTSSAQGSRFAIDQAFGWVNSSLIQE